MTSENRTGEGGKGGGRRGVIIDEGRVEGND